MMTIRSEHPATSQSRGGNRGFAPLPWLLANDGWRAAAGRPAGDAAGAALALLAQTANLAITHQVSMVYAVADFWRRHAEAIAHLGRASLPEGPVRAAVATVAASEREAADTAMAAASEFGRRFGHLAFAFPVAPG
jgi:hypothetical protein